MTAPADPTAARPQTPPAGPTKSGTAGSAGGIDWALRRYRVVAYVVGVVLITLMLVGMPLKYLADTPEVVRVVGPAHGILYVVYLLVTFDLANKAKLGLRRMLLVMLAGTVPFVSFVAERWVHRTVRAGR